MIHVIATIEIDPARRNEYLNILKGNVPLVQAEKGCLRYEPTVDVESGLPAQGGVRADVITLLETWENLAALRVHLQAPHMAAYREKVKGMVRQVRLQVLEPA